MSETTVSSAAPGTAQDAGISAALGNRSIVLVGMMGAGKSTIGRRLLVRLGLPFLDADVEIEAAAGMSGIDMPAAASISTSASRNGSPSRTDSLRPMVDLPAPIIPTNTIERLPRAAEIPASWAVPGAADETVVSDISLPNHRSKRRFKSPYYPRR